jgi:hypothetical protein
MNIAVKYNKDNQEHMILLHAPYPGEFVDMGPFWVQTVSLDGITLLGFDVWYREKSQHVTFKWLESIFSSIPNFIHSYHPVKVFGEESKPLLVKN